MCGRYFIADDQEEREIKKIIKDIEDRSKAVGNPIDLKTGEIFPTNVVPVLTKDVPQAMAWGFKGFQGKGHLINARVETANQKPTFRTPYSQNRCLIPASWFFEWRTVDKKKEKYAIGKKEPIYMAGLYRMEKDLELPVFVILTMPASPSISFIHDRMPVIVPKEHREAWLDQAPPVGDLMDISTKELQWKVSS
ncbi:SOS response-associated peptidase [Alkalibacter rhizosphaerae]|uniref:Abasic site processing protein n=1 Tax=Alkalibacter rhizosphaerae TaxID=2815577 RepID=A0A974XDJ7_9FIRM|nr:SOS response-associated peptidase [Alkalibacter rhizosphaerae]QSX07877.1 SOS response-associated peptidase [Alkalibacter rhizosphaerae]